jgi:hypothetical protein
VVHTTLAVLYQGVNDDDDAIHHNICNSSNSVGRIYYLEELQMNPQLQTILHNLFTRVKALEDELEQLKKEMNK